MKKTFFLFIMALPLLWPCVPAQSAEGGKGLGRVEGVVSVVGTIPRVKVKKAKVKFNPYGYASYGSARKDDADGEKEKRDVHMVVYLEGVPWSGKVPSKPELLGQKNKQFSVDVLPVLGGSRVEITNDEEEVYHHIFSKKKPWNFDLKKKGPGEKNTVRFQKAPAKGVGVVPVFCNFHSNMNAHVLVMENPFYASLPEAGGAFTLKGVPPGTYTLTAWHPSLKPEKTRVTVSAGKTARPRLVMRGEEVK